MQDAFTSIDDVKLACQTLAGREPTIVWLSGFGSDMTGAKAMAVKDWAQTQGRGFLAFDYFGHGASGGDFSQGTIGRWRADALAAIDQLSAGPLLLIGSSMGGWIASLAAVARPQRIAGLVLIAPALDFTQALLWPSLPDEARAELETTGQWLRPGGGVITRQLIEEGRQWSLLSHPIAFAGPVRILQGQEDQDVPWRHALKVAQAFESRDVRLTLFKRAGHRLSEPDEIAALLGVIAEVASTAD
jgi:pimeloyl-ACP methyl ester carboxylesterase